MAWRSTIFQFIFCALVWDKLKQSTEVLNQLDKAEAQFVAYVGGSGEAIQTKNIPKEDAPASYQARLEEIAREMERASGAAEPKQRKRGKQPEEAPVQERKNKQPEEEREAARKKRLLKKKKGDFIKAFGAAKVTDTTNTGRDRTDTTTTVRQHPLVSVCIPVYEGAEFLDSLLHNVTHQTYPNLEIVLSLDSSEDAERSYNIIQKYQQMQLPNKRTFRVYKDQNQEPGFIPNVNFVLSHATGEYRAVLPVDDGIPLDYYERLANCLDQNPEAVNCFPHVVSMHCQATRCKLKDQIWRVNSMDGDTIDSRVYKSVNVTHPNPLRGLVRMPADGQPYLLRESTYQKHPVADMVLITQQAVKGKLLAVDVPYYKLGRDNSTMGKLMNNSTKVDHKVATFGERAVQEYQVAGMMVSNSYQFYRKLLKRVNECGIKSRDPSWHFKRGIARVKRVAILGAGIQGTMMALLFAKHGYDVTIYDKAPAILHRASSNQEGKIHLGMVYSNDATMKTGRHMLESALRFAPMVEELVGHPIDWNSWKSTPFQYLVPHTSHLSTDQIEDFFAKLQEEYHQMLQKDPSLHYLGERPKQLYQRLASPPSNVNHTFFEGAIDSEEYAISHKEFADTVSKALKKRNIRIHLNSKVDQVQRRESKINYTGKFRIFSTLGEHDVDTVVNCLWEGRHVIDKQLGLPSWSGNNVRLKLGIYTKFIPELAEVASATMVNGPFGDFVHYPKENRMYFSWYPVSMVGMVNTDNEDIPKLFEDLASHKIPPEVSEYEIRKHQEKFRQLFPGSNWKFEDPKLVGGFILGNGGEDINDAKSLLHLRSDDPIYHEDGYFSISTQKFTMGPYNAWLLEQQYLKETAEEDESLKPSQS